MSHRSDDAPSVRDGLVTIHVDDTAPGRAISPDLWGIFFEDINYSADGGLYAELVQNRSFRYSSLDSPSWDALTGWEASPDSGVAVAYDELPYLLVAPGARVVNSGFDGMNVVAGEEYDLTIRGTGRVHAQLESDSGGTVSDGWLEGADREPAWLTLVPTASAARGRLVLDFPDGGVLRFASLMPRRTFRGLANGLRPDLAQALADLQPKFMRFPGGCVAHGLGLENMYRWKGTLGPVEEREQSFNLWGYHQSMGFGYFEYFEFCEQIGAKPVPVLAAGVCCQNTIGGPQAIADEDMPAYIQEVLDLVEWANGPAESPWGSVRAAAGHPEPFGLEYLAIGNEDQQDDIFRNRFTGIQMRVRAAHPELTLIGTVGPAPVGDDYDQGWEFAREQEVDLVDEHAYKSPRWFFENLDRFDHYDRTGPAVYLGEYGSWGNTLLNALSEAAFMGAMERNGDIVRLASYAPLLAKIDHTQWVPDLIYFDNERVLPTLNYFVQQMHSQASGDTALPVRVENAPHFARPAQDHASIAVNTTGARLALREVTLTGNDPTDLEYAQVGEARVSVSTDSADYDISLLATLTEGDDGFAIRFGAVDTPDYFEWNFGTWKNRSSTLFATSDDCRDEIQPPVKFSVEVGRAYDVRIAVRGRGRTIRCSLDGEIVHEYEDALRPEERFSATAVRDNDLLFVKVVNATPDDVIAEVRLASGHSPAEVKAVQLVGPPTAGAPFVEAPVRPAHSTVDLDVVRLPAYSFTVLSVEALPRT